MLDFQVKNNVSFLSYFNYIVKLHIKQNWSLHFISNLALYLRCTKTKTLLRRMNSILSFFSLVQCWILVAASLYLFMASLNLNKRHLFWIKMALWFLLSLIASCLKMLRRDRKIFMRKDFWQTRTHLSKCRHLARLSLPRPTLGLHIPRRSRVGGSWPTFAGWSSARPRTSTLSLGAEKSSSANASGISLRIHRKQRHIPLK